MAAKITGMFLLVLFVLGCPESSNSADGGESDAAGDVGRDGSTEAGRTDVGGTDVGGTDVGSMDDGRMDVASEDVGIDSAAIDAAQADAGDDASAVDASADAEDPCATVGCSVPPMCGEACTAMCGCCDCGSGGSCGAGVALNCAGGCFLRTTCGDSDCAVDPASGVAFCGSCRTVQAQYDSLTSGAATRCGGPDACRVLNGHCGVGLGGCYHGVHDGVTQGELDVLAAQWVALGCDVGAAVCDCAAPPSVRCDAGGCLLRD